MSPSARRQMRIVAGLFVVGSLAIGALLYLCWPVLGLMFDGQRTGRPYSIPSRSMMPNLIPGDRILPRIRQRGEPTRGEVIVYRRTKDEVRVARVAGLGGDTIEIRGGFPWINGTAARRRYLGAGPTFEGNARSLLYAERLPDERSSHRVIKMMPTAPLDEMPATKVPPDRLFVLGDNRDQAADSRAPIDEMGAGMVRLDQVLGVVDYVAWSSVKGRMARPIDRADPVSSPKRAER
jgi:signal peptidase I